MTAKKVSQYIITFNPYPLDNETKEEIASAMDKTADWIKQNSGKIIETINESYIKVILANIPVDISRLQKETEFGKYIENIQRNENIVQINNREDL